MKRLRLKKKQPRTGLRKTIETHVISMNSRLTKVVQYMTTDVLLAHCHPIDRKAFAFALKQEGELSENLVKEYGL